MVNDETIRWKIPKVHVLGNTQCARPEMSHAQFKVRWGWVLQAGVTIAEQTYSRCVNVHEQTQIQQRKPPNKEIIETIY